MRYVLPPRDARHAPAAHFAITGQRDEAATGVWVALHADDDEAQRPVNAMEAAKICAMGVRVSRWVTMHGLALNVTTDLQHFQLIVPCGLAGRQVTSMAQLLRQRCPTMDEVKRVFVEQFNREIEGCDSTGM